MLLTHLSLEQKGFRSRRNEERDGNNTFHARGPGVLGWLIM